MRFQKARFTNFRLLRDVDLEFSLSHAKPLTVIRAENETGKTTILNGLQWILFGSEGLPNKGIEYRLHPIDWDKSATVDIEAQIVFDHTFQTKDSQGNWTDSTEVYVARRQATERIIGSSSWSRVGESFDLFHKTTAGYVPVKGGELLLRQMLASNLKDLFFTDGDRALSFITSEIPVGDKRKMVQRAIRDMLGFQIMEDARSRVHKAIGSIRAQVKEFPGAEALQRASDRLAELDVKSEENEKRLEDIDRQLGQIMTDLQSISQKIEAAAAKGDREALVRALNSKRQELAGARQQLDRLRQEHSAIFRKESLAVLLLHDNLAKAASILNDQKAKGKIPRTALPILLERLEMGVCICGVPLQPGHPQYDHVVALIEQQKASSSTDDRLTTLRLVGNQKVGEFERADDNWISQMKLLVERRGIVQKRIEDLEAEIKEHEAKLDEVPQTDIAFLRSQRAQLLETKEKLDREKGSREADLRRIAEEKQVQKKNYDTLLKKQVLSHRLQCRLAAAQDVYEVLSKSYVAIERDEIPMVSKAMNQYFLEMIGANSEQNALLCNAEESITDDADKNALICRTEITSSYDIAVFGPQDRGLDPDRDLNGAARRALTLAFILALTEVSGVTAPNAIDTPLGMMSGIVKRSVLSTLVDHATQPVLFLTRSEIRDCEDLLDQFAGKIITLSNSAHFPTMLSNNPSRPYAQVIRCDCNHRQYCKTCQRLSDNGNPLLALRL